LNCDISRRNEKKANTIQPLLLVFFSPSYLSLINIKNKYGKNLSLLNIKKYITNIYICTTIEATTTTLGVGICGYEWVEKHLVGK